MFRAGRPVTGEAFFDREAELGRITKLVNRAAGGTPEWLAILGMRKVGKSSLLQESARRSAIPFVTFDLFEEGPLGLRFFRTYILRVLDNLFPEQLQTSLEATVRSAGEFRAAVSRIGALLPSPLPQILLTWPDKKLDEELVNLAINVPEQVASAHGLKLVIAIDEFQELERTHIRNVDIIARLRSHWQRHEHVGYIVSGSERTMLTEMISSYHAPFYGHFDIMELGGFPLREAREFLRSRGLNTAVATELVRIFGTCPYYLQLAGAAVAELPKRATRADVRAALQSLTFSRSGRLHLYFEGYYQRIVGNSGELSAMLAALSAGPQRLTDVAKQLGTPSGSTSRYLDRLGEIVRKRSDGLYEVTDHVFASWLAWRAPGGGGVPMQVLGDEAEKRVAKALAQMGFELVYQARASRGAFDLLAFRAHHQLALQVKRRAKLPLRFKKSEWSRMAADAERFGWRWLVVAVVGSEPIFLDPAKAKSGREIRLHEQARIDNLPGWLT